SRAERIEERVKLLEMEKAFTKERDQLSQLRRELPWVRVEKEYVFDAAEGRVSLGDLLDGRSQLLIKHFMMGPGQPTHGVCRSFGVGRVAGLLVHLQHDDLSYVVVARAPIDEIEAVRARMGWRFRWVSSYGSDFNYDFHVSFTPEEIAAGRGYYNFRYIEPGLQDLSGDSVFIKDDTGEIFHTYSTY